MKLHQRNRALHGREGAVDVGAALEARGCFRLQAEPLARLSDGRRLEVRAFEHDRFGRRRDLRVRAAHHARDGLRAVAVGNHEHVVLELTFHAVQRRDDLALPRAPHSHFRSGELREVEGVHRMAALDEHVVRDVDDRADGPHAGGLQPRGHPRRRGDTRDVGNRADVPRPQLLVVDRDRDSIGVAGAARAAPFVTCVGAYGS